MKCKDCGWWKPMNDGNDGARMGRCRGRAPSVTVVVVPKVNQIANTVIPQLTEVTAWPTTPADCEACGDFKTCLKVPERLRAKDG